MMDSAEKTGCVVVAKRVQGIGECRFCGAAFVGSISEKTVKSGRELRKKFRLL